MRTWIALLFALATSTALADQAKPKPAAPAKTKATDASVTALRDRLAKARDELRAAIAKPPEKMTADEQKRYASLAASVKEMADGADATVAKLTAGLKSRESRDTLSELGEEQQLKMQMIMERMTKADSAASNVIKKFRDLINQIISNLK